MLEKVTICNFIGMKSNHSLIFPFKRLRKSNYSTAFWNEKIMIHSFFVREDKGAISLLQYTVYNDTRSM